MLQTLPNPAVLLSPITTNEAVLSSRIEGTQATLDDVLEYDAGMDENESKKGDIEEISNYRSAIFFAEKELENRNLTLSFIKQMHQRLMQGVRGQNKDPGNFRVEQNWIGRHGDKIENARFIPPSPMIMHSCLENLEKYINLSEEEPIIQTLVSHAQFEIIHPFKDGNGRVGRMLIPLVLYKNRLISAPMFYMSEYLEENRSDYYDKLLEITKKNDWHSWLVFSINALIMQAEKNFQKVKKIRDLYEGMMKEFVNVTHSQFAPAAVEAFFMRPIMNGPTFYRTAKFNNKITANAMLKQLETAGLIRKIRESSGRKPSVYAMPALIEIAEGKEVI